LGIGDWGLGIGPIPNPQTPIPQTQNPKPKKNLIKKLKLKKNIKFLKFNKN